MSPWLSLASLDLHPLGLQPKLSRLLVAEHEAQAVDLIRLDWPHALNPPAKCRGNEVLEWDSYFRPLVLRGRQLRPVRESHPAALGIEIDDVLPAIALRADDDRVSGLDVQLGWLRPD